MAEDNKAYDAMGNEIVIGQLYGYSRRSNGYVVVVIGEVTKINKESVRLMALHRGKALYQDKIAEDDFHKATHISVSSNTLFPINSSEVAWG